MKVTRIETTIKFEHKSKSAYYLSIVGKARARRRRLALKVESLQTSTVSWYWGSQDREDRLPERKDDRRTNLWGSNIVDYLKQEYLLRYLRVFEYSSPWSAFNSL